MLTKYVVPDKANKTARCSICGTVVGEYYPDIDMKGKKIWILHPAVISGTPLGVANEDIIKEILRRLKEEEDAK